MWISPTVVGGKIIPMPLPDDRDTRTLAEWHDIRRKFIKEYELRKDKSLDWVIKKLEENPEQFINDKDQDVLYLEILYYLKILRDMI